jgi:hypothetical protein
VAACVELLSGVGTVCMAPALLWTRLERIVWQPPAWGGPDPDPPPAGARRLAYTAEDGQALFAWVVDPPDAAPGAARAVPAPTLLAFHGNAELAAWGVPWAREVARRTGWRVALPEYRGYAGLGGEVGHLASRRDARAALAAVRADATAPPPAARRVRPLARLRRGRRAGRRAGGGRRAARGARAPGAVHLGAGDDAPLRPGAARPLVGARRPRALRHGGAVAELDAPVWVAHGALDLVVPQRMGRAVHAAARCQGEWLALPTAGHNDVPAVGGARYWAWLERALAAATTAAAAAVAPAERVVRVER